MENCLICENTLCTDSVEGKTQPEDYSLLELACEVLELLPSGSTIEKLTKVSSKNFKIYFCLYCSSKLRKFEVINTKLKQLQQDLVKFKEDVINLLNPSLDELHLNQIKPINPIRYAFLQEYKNRQCKTHPIQNNGEIDKFAARIRTNSAQPVQLVNFPAPARDNDLSEPIIYEDEAEDIKLINIKPCSVRIRRLDEKIPQFVRNYGSIHVKSFNRSVGTSFQQNLASNVSFFSYNDRINLKQRHISKNEDEHLPLPKKKRGRPRKQDLRKESLLRLRSWGSIKQCFKKKKLNTSSEPSVSDVVDPLCTNSRSEHAETFTNAEPSFTLPDLPESHHLALVIEEEKSDVDWVPPAVDSDLEEVEEPPLQTHKSKLKAVKKKKTSSRSSKLKKNKKDFAKPFVCTNCSDAAFRHEDRLHFHIRKIHENKEKPYDCPECKEEFLKLSELRQHEIKHTQNSSNEIHCKLCSMTFYKESKLAGHMRVCSRRPLPEGTKVHPDQKRKHECGVCTKKFQFRHRLMRHYNQTHTDKCKTICEFCSQQFSQLYSLKWHQRRVHPEETLANTNNPETEATKINSLKCSYCPAVLSSKGIRLLHEKKHRGELHFQCEICGASKVSLCELKIHMNLSHVEGNYQCDFCPRVFSQKGQVLRHTRRKHPESRKKTPQTFECETCKKIFYLKYKLDRHKNIHIEASKRSNEYECTICNYSTFLKHNLNLHSKTKSHILKVEEHGKDVNVEPLYGLIYPVQPNRSLLLIGRETEDNNTRENESSSSNQDGKT